MVAVTKIGHFPPYKWIKIPMITLYGILSIKDFGGLWIFGLSPIRDKRGRWGREKNEPS